MVSWATRRVHRDRMDEFRPHLLKLGFVELKEGLRKAIIAAGKNSYLGKDEPSDDKQ